jgi:sugar lactone lactonase YvrE
MSTKIAVEVFDERKCYLGEGPTSSGPGNNHVMWVNILENQVMWRNLETGVTGGYETSEHVSFAIPRTQGGEVLGTVSGPILRDSDGTIHQLPTRSTIPGDVDNFPTRWNDAKVSRIDKDFTITAEINIPTPYVTSCVFAGPELDTLIITTAHNGEADAPSQAGMTFICKPGVKGVVTNLFPM